MSNTKNTEFVSKRREPAKVADKHTKRLLTNSAICAALAMGILCLSAVDTDFAHRASTEIQKAATSEMVLDENLGRIQFVDTSLPVADGTVVETFAESGRAVQISGEPSAAVMAVLAGTVTATDEDSVTIQNDNGTRSTYMGVVPTVTAGEYVAEETVIGTLAEEALALETVGGAGFVDSLDEAERKETME